MYLGRLTLAANGLVISDGTKVRDSTAVSVPKARSRRIPGKAKDSGKAQVTRRVSPFLPWQDAFRARSARRRRVTSASTGPNASAKKARDAFKRLHDEQAAVFDFVARKSWPNSQTS